MGYVESGGVIFNHLSAPDGSLAIYNEIDSLDSCFGHSNDVGQYHYHGVSNLQWFGSECYSDVFCTDNFQTVLETISDCLKHHPIMPFCCNVTNMQKYYNFPLCTDS